MSARRSKRAAVAAGCAALGFVPAAVVGLPAAVAGPSARGASSGPAVTVMVVGAGNVVLSQPRAVAAGGAGVQASGRRCAVAAGTPLAALVALHAQGGPAFAIRDYGHCNSSARNSGQLFVYSLDGETNHGQNGWEYKVGNLAGSAGAADPSGPEGDGRLLRAGQRVLWFWCEAYAGGCERTLEVSAASSVARGGRLAVRVTGYENEGRGVAVAGATVRLGSSSASTARSGTATLTAPSAGGRYALSASRSGSVPAFPETVTVR